MIQRVTMGVNKNDGVQKVIGDNDQENEARALEKSSTCVSMHHSKPLNGEKGCFLRGV